MGSSSNSDFSAPPQGPPPPANMIAPHGQAAPFNPHFINFLGDTNVPSRGLTPEMLAAINATNGPAPGAMPPRAAAGAGAGAGAGAPPVDHRQMLAQALAAYQTPERGYNPARGGGMR